MKIQEAIEVLKGIAEEASESEEAVCYVATDEDIDALNMAIKALEHLLLPRIIIGQGEKEPKCEDCKWNTWDNNCMVEYRGCRFEPKRESDTE